MILLYVYTFFILGLWLTLKAHDKNLVPREFLFIGSIAASLSVYYFVFYLYVLSPPIGHIAVLVSILVSLSFSHLIISSARKSKTLYKTLRFYYAIPLLITFTLLIAYSLLFYSCIDKKPGFGGYRDVDNRTFCHISHLPFDNALPFIYGENILRNEDNQPAIDWSIADRPPLQIAATLPILKLAKQNPTEGFDKSLQFARFSYYHIFAVLLQLGWVGAIWGALQKLKVKKSKQILIFTTFAATGFFYLNSVFVWPKLLAASLVFSGMIIFIHKNRRVINFNYLPFAGVLMALGLLSHGGVLFTIVPFAFLLAFRILRSKRIEYKYIISAFLLSLSLLMPWQIYKSTLVKADRLAKWHFAGIIPLEDNRGTTEAIVEEYQKLSFEEWLSNKKQNAITMVTGNYAPSNACALNAQSILNKCIFGEWRTITFFSSLFALEAINIGWVVVGYRFIKRKVDNYDKDIVFLILASLLFWGIAMFLPGSTVVHQGSYVTMMLLFIFLAKHLVAHTTIYIIIFVTIIQIVIFYLSWIAGFFRSI